MKTKEAVIILLFLALCLVFWGYAEGQEQAGRKAREVRWEETIRKAEADCWRIYGAPCPRPSEEQMLRQAEEVSEGIKETLRGEDGQ